MNSRTGAGRAAKWPALILAALAVSACTPGGDSSGSPSPQPSATAAVDPSADGSDARAILEPLAATGEVHGSGYGRLRSPLSNTLANTPDGVLGITFGFTCTGGGTSTVKVAAGGAANPSAADTVRCDGSIFQKHVDVPKPGPVSFQAHIDGSTDGSFAYVYLTDRK